MVPHEKEYKVVCKDKIGLWVIQDVSCIKYNFIII